MQSIGRAFSLLELMADAGGTLALSQLANQSGLPLPTIHRLLRTLVDLGYIRQESSRHYVLGPRLIRLGDASSKMLSVWARPHLARLVDELGESANLAMLDGDEIVYVAQAQSRHSMRMFTEVGRRVEPHCTAVGKAIMAHMPIDEVREILKRSGMHRHTDTTITDPERVRRAARLVGQARIRRRRRRARDRRALCRRCHPRHIVPTRPVGIRTRGPGDRPAYREGRAAVDGCGQGTLRRLELILWFSCCARCSNAYGDSRTARRSRARSRTAAT